MPSGSGKSNGLWRDGFDTLRVSVGLPVAYPQRVPSMARARTTCPDKRDTQPGRERPPPDRAGTGFGGGRSRSRPGSLFTVVAARRRTHARHKTPRALGVQLARFQQHAGPTVRPPPCGRRALRRLAAHTRRGSSRVCVPPFLRRSADYAEPTRVWMGIDMGQHLAGHVASVSRDLVLEWGDRGIHGLVAVFFHSR
jgi:hypothetical protein